MIDYSDLLNQCDTIKIRLHWDLLICLEDLNEGLKVSDDQLKYAIYRINNHLKNLFLTDEEKAILNNIKKHLETLRG